jgi:hypothetical protein
MQAVFSALNFSSSFHHHRRPAMDSETHEHPEFTSDSIPLDPGLVS